MYIYKKGENKDQIIQNLDQHKATINHQEKLIYYKRVFNRKGKEYTKILLNAVTFYVAGR